VIDQGSIMKGRHFICKCIVICLSLAQHNDFRIGRRKWAMTRYIRCKKKITSLFHARNAQWERRFLEIPRSTRLKMESTVVGAARKILTPGNTCLALILEINNFDNFASLIQIEAVLRLQLEIRSPIFYL